MSEKNPWRFYTAEHLWNRLIEVSEQKEILENKLFIYSQLINLFVQRDEAMRRLATAETEKIKDVILDNVGIINQQIESLMINLEISEEDYE
jgi:hypothetical protein